LKIKLNESCSASLVFVHPTCGGFGRNWGKRRESDK